MMMKVYTKIAKSQQLVELELVFVIVLYVTPGLTLLGPPVSQANKPEPNQTQCLWGVLVAPPNRSFELVVLAQLAPGPTHLGRQPLALLDKNKIAQNIIRNQMAVTK